jgi:hypothetical protein
MEKTYRRRKKDETIIYKIIICLLVQDYISLIKLNKLYFKK